MVLYKIALKFIIVNIFISSYDQFGRINCIFFVKLNEFWIKIFCHKKLSVFGL